MGNKYLIVSDLHLADLEEHSDGWKSYKSRQYCFDPAFIDLVHDFMSHAGSGQALTLVLNGDIFDFDLVLAIPDDPPWPVSGLERKRGLKPTADKTSWQLELILSQHPQFVEVLAEFLAAGHRLIYVMGNHDRAFHFPKVQRVLIEALESSAAKMGRTIPREALQFEPWFYYVPGEIYVEHGQQYDSFTSFQYLLWPVVTIDQEEEIALPMGNLSNRYLISHLGFFNPHASDYILNAFNYLKHWFKFYAFSRRSPLFNWLWGSLLIILRLITIQKKLRSAPQQHLAHLKQLVQRYNLTPDKIQALGRLQPQPITSRFYSIIRELWLDRVLLAAVMGLVISVLLLTAMPLWTTLLVPLGGLLFLYGLNRRRADAKTIFSVDQESPARAKAIGQMLPARVVAFGHTHNPRQIPLSADTCFVDTGTWAPVMDAGQDQALKPGLRNYVLAAFDQQQMSVQLCSRMIGVD